MTSGQFMHVTQFYETILATSILILTAVQVTTLFIKIEPKIINEAVSSHQTQIEWSKQKANPTQHKHEEKQIKQRNSIEKSVADYVQNMESSPQQQKQNGKKQVQIESLSIKQQKFYILYKSFNQFMNEKMAVLMPLLVIGILTQSIYIYSLATFFLAILCDVIIHVLRINTNFNGLYDNILLIKFLKALEILFVMSIFLPLWIVKQFNPS